MTYCYGLDDIKGRTLAKAFSATANFSRIRMKFKTTSLLFLSNMVSFLYKITPEWLKIRLDPDRYSIDRFVFNSSRFVKVDQKVLDSGAG